MKIVWTLEAQKDLKKIYKFYAKNVSIEIAQKTVLHILNKVKTLELGVELGQEEDVLKHLEQGHRYLIAKHNKII